MSSQPQLAAVTSAAAAPASKNVRIPKEHDIAALFPEIQNFAGLPQLLRGFASPGAGVPCRIADFIQERSFVAKMCAYLTSSWTMLTLFGPTGCGKTDRVLDFYARLNIPVLHDVATGDMKLWDLVGGLQLANNEMRFVPGKLYKAMKYGFPYLIDEVYRLSPRITSKLHMVRDRGEISIDDTGETLRAAPGFKLIQTSNQSGFGDMTGMHSGDNVQDAAFLNGSMVMKCGYPDEAIEKAIVKSVLMRYSPAMQADPTVAQDYAEKMLQVAKSARCVFVGNDNASTSQRIEIPFSTRTLVMWAEMFVKFRDMSQGVHPLYDALDFVALDRACPSTRATVDSFVLASFSLKRDATA